MQRFLIIQTAFIGDVVLATAVVEKLRGRYPEATIDFLLRKGNEGLLKGHPFIEKVLVWDKTKAKQRNLLRMVHTVRKRGYSHIINLHRFATSGLITTLSGAKVTIGFDKNPLSRLYTKRLPHVISEPYSSDPVHEVARNQTLIAPLTDNSPAMPRLYPSAEDYQFVQEFQAEPYVCIAPSSVWPTKQFPVSQWIALVKALPEQYTVFLLGGKGDAPIAEEITAKSNNRKVKSLCGKLNFLQSAALMEAAAMNYANDSAPLHFASAVEAPSTAVFCSTVPAFGFGPLSAKTRVVEIEERLYCRPCGLHGKKACPEGHFRCALDIKTSQLLWWT